MIRPRIGLLAVALPLLLGVTDVATAQVRPGSGAPQTSIKQPARRQQLEQQLRRRLWSVTKDRVGLSDAQMTRLGETSARFDARRRTLNQAERAERVALRQQILAGDRADQGRIASGLDRLLQLQRQRVELQAAEQQELATYLTPIQRAKFAALQEQVRRRAEALRRQRPDSGTPFGAR
jgi:periplasmic protein CpxP/Spy